MEVPERLKALCEEMREEFGAERLYVVDLDEEAANDLAGTLVFGMRQAATPALTARLRVARVMEKAIEKPVGVELFTDPETEVEYIFDKYLRPYIATHGGVVTVATIDEAAKKLWINMDGGCSGCPESLATLKHGIERTLRKHLPWVERVDTVNEPLEPDFNIALDFSAADGS